MCLWGISTLRNYIWESYSQKTPSFLAGIGIPSLNVQSNNFRTARPILVIRSSSDASPKKEARYAAKMLKFDFGELLPKNSTQREFPSQNTPFCNFLTTQPIHTNSNSIDAVRLVKHQTKLKHVKNFDLGEQFSRKFPKGIS
jgi:hypothetical protein